MSELKPCPFCGDQPKQSTIGDTYKIECESAFCGMSSIHGPIFDAGSTTEAWNNRPHENKIKADTVRESFIDGAECFGVSRDTALAAWETSDSKLKLKKGEI
jgi:hypothetical protein